jgi:hypothetical protein
VLRAASVWASFLSSSTRVLADDSPTQKVQSTESIANPDRSAIAEPSPESPEQRAAVAYQEALASYAKGDVTSALNNMRESYQLSKRAELLYNVAQLEAELKACSDALTDYQRYLELVPNGRHRDLAEQAERRLAQQCPPPAATPTPVTTASAGSVSAATDEAPPPNAEPVQDSYWTGARIIGWSAITVGGLTGASALYFQLEAIQAKHDLQQSVDDALAGGPPVDKSLQDRQQHYNHAAIGLGITAGALVAGGVLVLLLDPGRAEQRMRSASVYALPGLVGASYAQRF